MPLTKRQKQNIIYSLLALLGLILIAAVLWVNLKEYRFSKYKDPQAGFSVKYPATWNAGKNINGANVLFQAPLETDLDLFQESVNIVVQDISENPMSLQQYSDVAIDQMKTVFEGKIDILDSSFTRFAGQAAYRFEYIVQGKEGGFHFLHYWTIEGSRAYQFTYTAFESQFDTYILKVEKMASSFRIQ